jgi:hypothetical protein
MQAGISPSLQKQIEELSKRDINDNSIKKQAQRGMLIVHGSVVPTSLFCDVIEKNNLIFLNSGNSIFCHLHFHSMYYLSN